ncbi:MAG: cyclic nucleotide-binding domain-containing protein [Acidimicrobiales bacterium]
MALKKGDLAAIVDDLSHIALFASMSNADLTKLAKLGEPVDAIEGAVLMDQGDVGVECFLVLEGEAGVVIGGDQVVTIGTGSVVGEMALVGHKPRNASVIARSSMRLLSFNIVAFRRLLDEMPQARDHIYMLLRERAAANRDR